MDRYFVLDNPIVWGLVRKQWRTHPPVLALAVFALACTLVDLTLYIAGSGVESQFLNNLHFQKRVVKLGNK